MIRIRWETDYGLILLGYFVQNGGDGVRTAREIARWASLPLPMVSKILKTLAREGILQSHRGVKGGYSLAQGADVITLAEVIHALEGPIGMTECASRPGTCEKEVGCPMRPNWVRISQAFRETLERIPLAEIYAPPPPALIRLGEAGSRVR
jgi:FeS assembly SUF system regulator